MVDGSDYRILLEADFIVNAGESEFTFSAIKNAYLQIFETATGKSLLKSIYLRDEEV